MRPSGDIKHLFSNDLMRMTKRDPGYKETVDRINSAVSGKSEKGTEGIPDFSMFLKNIDIEYKVNIIINKDYSPIIREYMLSYIDYFFDKDERLYLKNEIIRNDNKELLEDVFRYL